jgi:hypothetical protein
MITGRLRRSRLFDAFFVGPGTGDMRRAWREARMIHVYSTRQAMEVNDFFWESLAP